MDKLGLYNEALEKLGETPLSSLTEDRDRRHQLDAVYDGGGIKRVLEAGLWNFATRSVELHAKSDVTPDFGLRYAFERPADFVRIVALCSDPYFRSPLIDYRDDNDYLYADITPVYLRYVSDDATNGGGDLSKWPQAFAEYAAFYFADRIRPQVTGSQSEAERQNWERKVLRALRNAKSRDAANQPPAFPPPSSWVTSRFGGGSRDRGNRGSLTG